MYLDFVVCLVTPSEILPEKEDVWELWIPLKRPLSDCAPSKMLEGVVGVFFEVGSGVWVTRLRIFAICARALCIGSPASNWVERIRRLLQKVNNIINSLF